MTKLRSMMNTANKGLTVTLPASYWYLQYFDIRKARLTSPTSCLTSVDGTVITIVNARR
ncbi:hypothetical protein DER45DRAFT_575934 [Fusarium avenaceum]|nr:hypothetical protein DER45DRAFT_575934 [Fusarium avenaceum]